MKHKATLTVYVECSEKDVDALREDKGQLAEAIWQSPSAVATIEQFNEDTESLDVDDWTGHYSEDEGNEEGDADNADGK